MSLVGVVFAFLKANERDHQNELWLEGTGVVTIVCSWLLVHTVFMLRYAHLYYAPPIGGIDFKMGAEEPDYVDFAYTRVHDRHDVPGVRHGHHAVARCGDRCSGTRSSSFLFGAVILATTVNVIAGLLNT